MSEPAHAEIMAALARACDSTEGGRAVFRHFFFGDVEEAMREDGVLFDLSCKELVELDVDGSTEVVYAFRLTKLGLDLGREFERKAVLARREEDVLDARVRRSGM